ncbi:MAG: hypothetical protein GY793_07070 [Proteobacteria bacterium]|nr:hypothetical protein [Pseudomonadota bacterium]
MKKILKHCKLWHDNDPPPITIQTFAEAEQEEEVTIDLDYFDMIARISQAVAKLCSLFTY